MTSIEINGTNYPLKFGLGFVRSINKKYKTQAEEVEISGEDAGLTYALGAVVLDKSVTTLIDTILEAAKTADNNQLTRDGLVEWIESDDMDINKLFEDVEDFFEKANFCKITLKKLKDYQKTLEAQEKALIEG